MKRDANLIGPNVAKFRYQRGWTQEELAVQLQLRGNCITRDVIANIESRRSASTDIHVREFARVLGVTTDQLFPPDPVGQNKKGPLVGLTAEIFTRRRADGSIRNS